MEFQDFYLHAAPDAEFFPKLDQEMRPLGIPIHLQNDSHFLAQIFLGDQLIRIPAVIPGRPQPTPGLQWITLDADGEIARLEERLRLSGRSTQLRRRTGPHIGAGGASAQAVGRIDDEIAALGNADDLYPSRLPSDLESELDPGLGITILDVSSPGRPTIQVIEQRPSRFPHCGPFSTTSRGVFGISRVELRVPRYRLDEAREFWRIVADGRVSEESGGTSVRLGDHQLVLQPVTDELTARLVAWTPFPCRAGLRFRVADIEVVTECGVNPSPFPAEVRIPGSDEQFPLRLSALDEKHYRVVSAGLGTDHPLPYRSVIELALGEEEGELELRRIVEFSKWRTLQAVRAGREIEHIDWAGLDELASRVQEEGCEIEVIGDDPFLAVVILVPPESTYDPLPTLERIGFWLRRDFPRGDS